MPKHKLKYNHQVGFDDLEAPYSVIGNNITYQSEDDWTDEDEAALEEYEENKRRKLAEQQEY